MYCEWAEGAIVEVVVLVVGESTVTDGSKTGASTDSGVTGSDFKFSGKHQHHQLVSTEGSKVAQL